MVKFLEAASGLEPPLGAMQAPALTFLATPPQLCRTRWCPHYAGPLQQISRLLSTIPTPHSGRCQPPMVPFYADSCVDAPRDHLGLMGEGSKRRRVGITAHPSDCDDLTRGRSLPCFSHPSSRANSPTQAEDQEPPMLSSSHSVHPA